MAIKSTPLTTSGDTTVYTSIGVNAVTLLIICNTASLDPTNEDLNSSFVNLNLVPSGDLSSDSNAIVKNLRVPPGETVFFSEERIVLDNDDSIRATASFPNVLTITVSTIAV